MAITAQKSKKATSFLDLPKASTKTVAPVTPAKMTTGMAQSKENVILQQKNMTGTKLDNEAKKLASQNNWTYDEGLATARANALRGPTSIKKTGGSGVEATYANGNVARTSSNPVSVTQSNQVAPGQTTEVNSQSGTNMEGDYTSTTDQAKALLQEQRDAQRAKEKELFGEEITAKTQKEEVQLFLDKQKEEKTALEQRIEQMNKIDQAQFDMSKADANAAVDANVAQFSQSREGVTSSGNKMISDKFASKTNKKIGIAQTQLEMQFKQREDLKKQLDEAQKNQKAELATSISETLAKVENQIRQEKLKMAELADAARTEAFDFLEKAPAGSFANMDIGQISMAFGVDEMTAGILQQADVQKQALEQRQFEMDEIEYQTKLADLSIKMENQKFAGMSDDMKRFMEYKTMLEYDPAGAEEFASFTGIKEKSFFSDFQQEYSVQNQQRQTIYEKTGVKVPIKSKYAYEVTPDGGISLEKSAPAGTPLKRGQCGAFVNDIMGGGLIKDSWASKKALVNSQVPVAGCVFMEATGEPWGHTGFVEKVYKDENGKVTGIDIRESNYVATETVSVAHIKVGDARWNKMSGTRGGFFIPGENRAKDQTVGGQMIEAGGSQGTGNAMLDQFAQAFADGKYDVADLKAMGMNASDIAMVTAVSFGKQREIDTSDYETFATAFANGDMSINDLKELGVPQEYLGKIAAYGIQNKDQLGGGNNGARATAEAILSSGGSMTLTDVPMEERAAVQAQINQLKSDPNFVDSEASGAKEKAMTIFNGLSTMNLDDLPVKEKAAVAKELNKLKEDAIKSGDIYGVIRASAGGSKPSEGTLQKFEKTANVISQVSQLTNVLNLSKREMNKVDKNIGPLRGWLDKRNPWNQDAQELNAVLQGTIPNLARGVFGEVGVLTNADVELYRKTLPNISQTADVQKSITALTLRTLRNSMENQLKVNSSAGVDVSGFLPFYSEIDQEVRRLEIDLGIPQKNSKSSGSSSSSTSIRNLVGRFFGGGKAAETSPWDDIDMDDPNDLISNIN